MHPLNPPKTSGCSLIAGVNQMRSCCLLFEQSPLRNSASIKNHQRCLWRPGCVPALKSLWGPNLQNEDMSQLWGLRFPCAVKKWSITWMRWKVLHHLHVVSRCSPPEVDQERSHQDGLGTTGLRIYRPLWQCVIPVFTACLACLGTCGGTRRYWKKVLETKLEIFCLEEV